MAAVDYFLSTLISELEAEQILSIEDLFGVIQVRFKIHMYIYIHIFHIFLSMYTTYYSFMFAL